MDCQSETIDLTVKTYFPSPSQPGGPLSSILDCLPLKSEVKIREPTGDIIYHGYDHFSIEGGRMTLCSSVSPAGWERYYAWLRIGGQNSHDTE